ncbi:MAG: STAS domain-containing protein [Fibrobacteres bacterium]|nr:STAS domain-containing protein [Fibrobacterota bacterium]
MEINVTKSHDHVVARLRGPLEISNVGLARERFVQILESGKDITLDFAGITEIDTAGIQMVLAVHADSLRQGKICRFVHPVPEVMEPFRLLRLDGLFDQSIATT